jgi:rhodanese-related sulfurtransferase
MKKFLIYFVGLFLITSFTFVSCKDEEVVEPAFETMTKYMVENDLDLPSILTYNSNGTAIGFVVGAPATADLVPAFLAKYYILDIRAAADFANGHLDGAKNIVFADILTEAASAGAKPILMVCYTGQTACYATSLLRLYGYRNAQALKWGMSGWNADFDKWTASVASIAQGHANWSFDAAPANVKYEKPVINENSTDGAAILEARVEAVVAAGARTVAAQDVIDNPNNYFVNNYFSEADFGNFGHVKGARRINPLTIADDIMYNIDPAAKVVTYCYTGQTSAIITAYLNVLGYDAYSLLFGMNKFFNSSTAWTSNQWGVDSKSKSYPYVK